NGPLNFQIALELAGLGVEIVCIVEAAPPPWSRFSAAWAMAGASPALAAKGAAIMLELRRRKVPILWRHRLQSIEGAGRAERVNTAHVDTGKPGPAFDVDAAAIGCGFRSANELARMLGCAGKANPASGEFEVDRDRDSATSVAGLYVVGEAGRFGGAQVA